MPPAGGSRALLERVGDRRGAAPASAGASPNSTPHTSVSPDANATTRQSTDGADVSRQCTVGQQRQQRAEPPHGQRQSGDRADPASVSPSASSWRNSRARSAPTAMRSAISRRRDVARTSCRLMTFAQAIEQEQQHRDEQRDEQAVACCLTRSPGARTAERRDPRSSPGMPRRAARATPFDVALGALERDARPEPADRAEPAIAARLERPRRRRERDHHHRHPDVGVERDAVKVRPS